MTDEAIKIIDEKCTGCTLCVKSCPFEAIAIENKLARIDLDKCTLCGACVEACLYHGIRLHPETDIPIICDLCGGDPYCAKHCVPGAIVWVDKTDDLVKEKKKLRSARMAKYRALKKEAA